MAAGAVIIVIIASIERPSESGEEAELVPLPLIDRDG
jgi:hypothetical protein